MARTANLRHAILDGCIEPGSKDGNRLNFNPVAFSGYLWKDGNDLWVPLIESLYPGRGNLSKLFKHLNKQGYRIIVPTAFDSMAIILKHLGFSQDWMRWEPSPNPEIRIGESGIKYEWHKMGIKMIDFPFNEKDEVNIWVRL